MKLDQFLMADFQWANRLLIEVQSFEVCLEHTVDPFTGDIPQSWSLYMHEVCNVVISEW